MVTVFNNICTPATVYIIIAIVMALVSIAVVLMRTVNLNLSSIISYVCSQIASIIVCYAIIIGVCSINETLAWVSVVLIAICALSTVVSLFVNPNYYNF